ncbi:MAG: ABC transporter substrate-binding protein [Acidimicrobiales bacterium]
MNRPIPRSRHLRSTAVVLLAAAALVLSACGKDDTDTSADSSSKTEVKIAYQAFGESEIAARIYGDVLEADGFKVSYQSFKDRAAIYAAFKSGDVNLVPEYAASGLEYLNDNAGEASPDITATAKALDAQLAKINLAAGTPSKAVDTNSLVVTADTSSSKKLKKISDLTADLKLGGPQDCPTNAGCIPALKKTYGLDFTSNFTPLDLGGPLTKAALKQGDIDVAVLFSTDAGIAANKWVVLTDDKGIFNADNIVPVGDKTLVADNKALLDKVSAKLTTANVTALNKRYDIDKDDATTIAADFVKESGL